MGQLMESDADEIIGIDVRREGGAAIIRRSVIWRQQTEKLQLRIPDGDVSLTLDQVVFGSGIESRIACKPLRLS